ncbi:uncharacterized protein BKCO1_8300032 [Diplodia corticola]|uniref:Uncharacterized protein n=1 Tax=Diplodia corticola TaxID=236234 RepID=A0A1J9RAB3_9PEZI|nr:uncharacterized protein BKCO1_8300032 [Diplodia corticola]OJD29355.1 hypothetical protein BKCO1_8300032 [Diplodia corticola]
MTLFKFLTTHAPPVRLAESSKSKTSKKKSKSLTTNKGYHQPTRLQPWEDFDLRTLQTMYDHILRHERDLPDPSQIRPSIDFALNEGGIGDFIQDSNRVVVETALKEAKKLLGRPEFVSMIRGHSAEPVRRTGNQKPFRPDWAGVRVGDDFAPRDLANILPGDTKDSRSWTFNDLLGSRIPDTVLDLGKYERPHWIQPLNQVFTYCVELKVRYGYVLSDRELLVLRIRPNQKGKTPAIDRTDVSHPEEGPPRRSTRRRTQEKQPTESNPETIEQRDIRNGILEFACIKGGSQNGDGLTVNLALWWLHLLALKDNTVQGSYSDLADEVLSSIEGRPTEEADMPRAGNGGDNDAGAVYEQDEDGGLSNIEGRLLDQAGTPRTKSGNDKDAGTGYEQEEDVLSEGSLTIPAESDGPYSQQDLDDGIFPSFQTEAHIPVVGEGKGSSSGKRRRSRSSNNDRKKAKV